MLYRKSIEMRSISLKVYDVMTLTHQKETVYDVLSLSRREYKHPFLFHGRQRLHKLEERLVVFPEIDPGPEPDQVI